LIAAQIAHSSADPLVLSGALQALRAKEQRGPGRLQHRDRDADVVFCRFSLTHL